MVSAFAGAQAQTLALKWKSGSIFGYRVSMEESRYSGDNPKPSETISNQTPIAFQVQGVTGKSATVQITRGPLVVKGRSVGRAKTATYTLDASGAVGGMPPTSFFTCLPANGAKVGQAWKAKFFGGPPLPAGVQADYRYSGISKDRSFAVVEFKVDAQGASRLQGRGKLFLRLSDGVLDHGNALFHIAYLRPDPNDPKKISVNSKVVLKYTITAG